MSHPATFFSTNRQKISEALPGAVIVLNAYALMQRGNDIAHVFEQEANFWYVTGIEEPGWEVVIDTNENKSWLLAPDIDDTHRVFEGGMSSEQASKRSGISTVIPQKEGEALLRRLSQRHSIVYALGEDPHASYYNFIENPAIKKQWGRLERIFSSVQNCRREIAAIRAIKQPSEIATMKKAIRLTVDSFEKVKSKLAQLQYEHEIEAEFDYQFKKNGATHAYEPIVASGKNACTLHYVKNCAKLQKQRLILMDVGARVDGYAADISRTYSITPASKRQQQVHAALEHAHHAIINLLAPNIMVEEYQRSVLQIMTQALKELGLVNTDEEVALRRYFPHAVSHGLGIDVHESLGAPMYFKEHMVLTVEPGIYIPEEGIGVRIEDDILITETGHKNLSGTLSTGL